MRSKTAFKFAILLTIAVAGPAMLGAQVQISSSPGGNIQIGGGGSGGAGGGQGCFVGSGGLVGAFTNGSGVIVETPVCIGGNGSISFAVPTGATQLQLGINDNKYTDDTGSFSINGTTMLQTYNNPTGGGDAADWASSVVGTCTNGTPRSRLAATKPVKSPTTPPPSATMGVARSTRAASNLSNTPLTVASVLCCSPAGITCEMTR